MNYPRMIRIRQNFDAPTLDDITCTVRHELAKLNLSNKIKIGDSVAISVGSRGIANIALVVKILVEALKAHGAQPFIVPSMGSHGGGTTEGQRAIVEGYGVTEAYTGAPIKATMEVVQVGITEDGLPVYFDKYAYEANHVVVVGRIKPHTEFSGEIESGLHKMMLIGLGKHKGAALYHQAIISYSFDRIIRSIAKSVIEKCKILLGLAIIENPNHETALIEALNPESFYKREKKLLILAKKWMPRLPFKQVDLLIVDQIGKDISGDGMDTNVIGRKYLIHKAADHEYPKITRIYVRDLTELTYGNATGMGIAEYAHTQLINKIDFEDTYINCNIANVPTSAAIPIHFDTDKKVLDAALNTIGYIQPKDARIIRIRHTSDIKEIMVSEIYQREMDGRDDLSIIEPAKEMVFNDNDNLLPF